MQSYILCFYRVWNISEHSQLSNGERLRQKYRYQLDTATRRIIRQIVRTTWNFINLFITVNIFLCVLPEILCRWKFCREIPRKSFAANFEAFQDFSSSSTTLNYTSWRRKISNSITTPTLCQTLCYIKKIHLKYHQRKDTFCEI